jgi:signal-transduction protein with cAMP-binding, CBS, and nucleotidyltransferase domain/PAS domain-containing protein
MKKRHSYIFATKIFLPAILTVVLFIIFFFRIVIPSFEKNMMDGKRATIFELTQTACSILEKYNQEVVNGKFTQEEAKSRAADEINQLRYGAENKDYFWITDMRPFMVIHPYRKDLNGKDLSDFKDPQGKKLFVEFVNAVKQKGEGYVDYMWQWKDDTSRIVQKLSYVRHFKPWGWIVGTGIYIEDVKAEIFQLEKRLFIASGIIISLITLLLLWVTRIGIKTEYLRKQAEKELKISHDRYKALVEASTEGTIMLLDSNVYPNNTFLSITGIDEKELSSQSVFEFFQLEKLFNCSPADFSSCTKAFSIPQNADVSFKNKTGEDVHAIINCSIAKVMDKDAIIINVRPIARPLNNTGDESLQVLSNLNFAVFISTFSRKPRLVSFSPGLVQLMGVDSPDALHNLNLNNLFADNSEQQHFLKMLLDERKITDYTISVRKPDESVFIANISASLYLDDLSGETMCTGVLYPVSHLYSKLLVKEEMLREIASYNLYLQQPVANFSEEPHYCYYNDSIAAAIEKMKMENTELLAVKTPEGEYTGVIYLRDVLPLLVEKSSVYQIPVYRIMQSPVPSIHQSATITDALALAAQTNNHIYFLKEPDLSVKTIVNLNKVSVLNAIYPDTLVKSISNADSIPVLTALHQKHNSFVGQLIDCGLAPVQATKMLSDFSEHIIAQLNKLAIEQLGKPPLDYCYLSFGSVGRSEQTFVTDQDNAIIYADCNNEMAGVAEKYFLELGTIIAEWLHQVGYEKCKGNMMASNPRWNVSLSEWKKYFKEWLNNSTPQSLLEISVFFDFKSSYGNKVLEEDLRSFIHEESKNKGAFYYNLAQSIMHFKPPSIVTGSISSDATYEQDNLDIKNAMAPLVMMIRLYAIFYNCTQINTISRVEELVIKGKFRKTLSDDFIESYQFLMSLRLHHQLEKIASGTNPTNFINPRKISENKRATLKRIFGNYSAYQTKIGYDFTGGTG